MVAVWELGLDEARLREGSLARLLSDWVGQSASGRAISDLDAVLRRDLADCVASPTGIVLVAAAGGRSVGLLAGTAPDESGGGAWITWVAVDPAWRRQGIGTELVEWFQALPALRAAAGVVNPRDSVAVAFWSALGWYDGRPSNPVLAGIAYRAPAGCR
jgi:GNAT superfamily N-acetyltransferase